MTNDEKSKNYDSQAEGRGFESRFPFQRAEAKRSKRKQKALHIIDMQGFFGYIPPLV